MKSFFDRLKATLSTMWHKAPAIEVAAASAINNLVPVVEQLDTIVLGPEALILNPILLALYTFGCHSLRHLIGGRKDVLSNSPVRKSCYDCVSGLNRRHMLWAWISMFYVGFVDLYIRLCAKGIWTDWRIL